VSLELLTVFVVAPMAVMVCYDIVKKNPRANILMIILATSELYGSMSLRGKRVSALGVYGQQLTVGAQR